MPTHHRVSQVLTTVAFFSCLQLAIQTQAQTQAQPQTEAAPRATTPRPTPIRSPEITPDRHVIFRLRAPAASSVVLTGEFMTGSKPFEKDPTGLWTVTVGPLEPEIYNYNFTIDGIRITDPHNPDLKTGTIASTTQSILNVPGDDPALYDIQPVPHGEIHTLLYDSKSLGFTRRANIYTPPGYNPAANTRYPVLYLFHGANSEETAWVRFGHINLILDNLLAARKIKPFLVVMPYDYPSPLGAEPPIPANGGYSEIATAFSRDLISDLIPFVQSRFRTYTDRDHRAIAGLSMGGIEALQIGLNHIDLFSYIGGFSPALRPVDIPTTFATLTTNPQTTNPQIHLLWFACGSDDGFYPASITFSKFLDDAQVKHTFQKSTGAHTWINWRQYLITFAPQLF